MECGAAMASPALVQELGLDGGNGDVAVVSPRLGGDGEPRALFMAIWSRRAWPYFSFFSTSIRRSKASQPVS